MTTVPDRPPQRLGLKVDLEICLYILAHQLLQIIILPVAQGADYYIRSSPFFQEYIATPILQGDISRIIGNRHSNLFPQLPPRFSRLDRLKPPGGKDKRVIGHFPQIAAHPAMLLSKRITCHSTTHSIHLWKTSNSCFSLFTLQAPRPYR